MANAITIFRMAASIVLLFCPAFSPVFYVFYIMAGLSDMLDGFAARKTKTASRFGARLDTIADYMFVIVCLIKLLPVIHIPIWLYVWIGIIALIKVLNIILDISIYSLVYFKYWLIYNYKYLIFKNSEFFQTFYFFI